MAGHVDLHMINKYVLWSYPMIMSETIILVESLRVLPAELRCYRRAWRRGRFNAAEVLFLLIKYLAITGWCLDAVIKDSDWLHSGHQCEVVHALAYFFMYIPVTLVALAIAWRTYIIFQCNRKVLCALILAVAVQLSLAMWTAFTQYRATILIQGFCNPLPKKPVPRWQHSSPWFLLYNFLYDLTVSSFSTMKLIKSTGGPRGVSQISRVLFYNNIHYIVIVCSCNLAEYVAMQTSRENMPSLLPISMAIQIITAINMLITEQDLVHGHNTGRSIVTPPTHDRNRGNFISSRFTPRNNSSSMWNSQSRGEDMSVSRNTFGSTSKVHDEGPPFNGIAYEQSKLCSLEEGGHRRGPDSATMQRRDPTGGVENPFQSPMMDEKSGNSSIWSPATATTVVGDSTFVFANCPRRPSDASLTAPPMAAAAGCTCRLGQQPVRSAGGLPGDSGRNIVGRKTSQGMSIREIRQQVESKNVTGDNQGRDEPRNITPPRPSFEISRGGPGASSMRRNDPNEASHNEGEETLSRSMDSSISTPPLSPNMLQRGMPLQSQLPTSSQHHGGPAPGFNRSESMTSLQELARQTSSTQLPPEPMRQSATSIDATNAGRAAASAMAKLSHSRQSSANTITSFGMPGPPSSYLSEHMAPEDSAEVPRENSSDRPRRDSTLSASDKEMLDRSFMAPPALDLSGDTQDQASGDNGTAAANAAPLRPLPGRTMPRSIDMFPPRHEGPGHRGPGSGHGHGNTAISSVRSHAAAATTRGAAAPAGGQMERRRNVPAPLNLTGSNF